MIDKNERWSGVHVDPGNIVCRTCKFKNGGGMKYPHYTKGSCDAYPNPWSKPHRVLFDGADCEYYEKED